MTLLKRLLFLIAGLLLMAYALFGPRLFAQSAWTGSASAVDNWYSIQHCDITINEHIYRPKRLKVLQACKTVTGTLMTVRKEKDGDEHWQMALDPGQHDLLNDRNISAQRGYLVIEPVCVHPVTQADAIAACKGFRQSFPVMKIGAHVQVIGPYVEDQEANHGWREIHGPTSVVAR